MDFLRKTTQIATLRDVNSGPKAEKRAQLPVAHVRLPPVLMKKQFFVKKHLFFNKKDYFCYIFEEKRLINIRIFAFLMFLSYICTRKEDHHYGNKVFFTLQNLQPFKS